MNDALTLDALDLPAWLDDETPTLSQGGMGLYTPDGELMPRDPLGPVPIENWHRLGMLKCLPENHRLTEFTEASGEVTGVSTIYLGLNHQWTAGQAIRIFETLIFAGGRPFDGYMWRYATRAAAMAGHQRVIDLVADLLGHPPQQELTPPGLDPEKTRPE